MLDKFAGTEFTVEYKYDGERAQVHVLEDGRVAIYRPAPAALPPRQLTSAQGTKAVLWVSASSKTAMLSL